LGPAFSYVRLASLEHRLQRHQARTATALVFGHLKAEGHLGRCNLKDRAGDAANAILSAVGYNFGRVLAWLRALLHQFLITINQSALNPGS
jgi:IS5 family transposase